jgi:hypothetical protein
MVGRSQKNLAPMVRVAITAEAYEANRQTQ